MWWARVAAAKETGLKRSLTMRAVVWVKLVSHRSLLCLTLALSGCQTVPEKSYLEVQPNTAPIRTITGFTEALHCMDQLLWAHEMRDIVITSAGLPDHTQKINAGTKDMLISAISRVSVRSGAFKFVDFDPTQVDVDELSKLIGVQADFQIPNYYIRGAITQLDDNVTGSIEGVSIALPMAEIGVSRDQITSIISVDMNLISMTSRQVLSGVSANNSIVIVRSGKGFDAGGKISKAGLSFNVSLNKSEGPSQAVRTLIELSTIELLGKLTQVPYWQCLQIDHTHPQMMREARDWFDGMKAPDRTDFVRQNLEAHGYLRPGDDDLPTAISRFQADHDLIANGRVDFPLYYKLLGMSDSAKLASHKSPSATPSTNSAKATEPILFLNTDRGPQPSYRLGETLKLRVEVAQHAFLYCFYRDSNNSVSRIYPNRFQSNAFIQGRHAVNIPPPNLEAKSFEMRFERAGVQEEVACLSSSRELGLSLPDALKLQDLQVLPVRSLDEVVGAFKALDRAGIRESRLSINIVP
ncbi:MAG: DUF4384 domain-containing protein [Gammaproteobacteria bacterium]